MRASTKAHDKGRPAPKAFRGQRGKSIEERVSFAVQHRTRVFILMLLNEGTYDTERLAEIIGESKDNVAYHIKELLDAGAIELAHEEPTRNSKKFFYRTIEMPNYSEEELIAMTPEERQAVIGATIQNMMAEMLSSFWSGKMEAYRKLWLGWRWFNLDAQGRIALAEAMEAFWALVQEIEAKSANRRAKSGEDAISMIVGLMGFPRERTAKRPPRPPANFSQR